MPSIRIRPIDLDGEVAPHAPAAARVAPELTEHARFVRELFERYRRPLIRYLTGLLARHEDAEDVLQDTYARLLGAEQLERAPARARAYLFRTATNLAYDRFRHAKVRGRQDDAALETLVSAEPAPEQIVAFDQGLELVKRAILEMPARCRRVFLLRATHRMGYAEIAERLGVSKRTVEREMKRALELCQKRLDAE